MRLGIAPGTLSALMGAGSANSGKRYTLFAQIISEHLRTILPHEKIIISCNGDEDPIIVIGNDNETAIRILIQETTLYVRTAVKQKSSPGNRTGRIHTLDLADPQSIIKLEQIVRQWR